jgi:hypothetical protein
MPDATPDPLRSLAATVRDPNTRGYVDEAVNAHLALNQALLGHLNCIPRCH